MDYEAQYQMTTEYVEQTFRENQDILDKFLPAANHPYTLVRFWYPDTFTFQSNMSAH